jgi:hypothetical protein
MSSIVLGLALLAVLLVVNSTFNHEYDNSRPLAQESSGQAPISVSDLDDLKGNLISLHNNGSIIPAWIVSGRWEISESANNSTNTNSGNINFNANVTMTSIDGMNIHRHKLVDFKLSNITLQLGSAIINGTTSFTSSGTDIGVAEKNIKLVPISIKIMNLNTISINMDNKMVMQHFGNSSLYGKVN